MKGIDPRKTKWRDKDIPKEWLERREKFMGRDAASKVEARMAEYIKRWEAQEAAEKRIEQMAKVDVDPEESTEWYPKEEELAPMRKAPEKKDKKKKRR